MSYRYMRTLLFFDLPTLTTKNQRDYRKFVKNLKKIGFYMIQESVYSKMSIDHQALQSIENKIRGFLPSNGNIMMLSVTEKQYSQMKILLGESTSEVVTTDQRTLIL